MDNPLENNPKAIEAIKERTRYYIERFKSEIKVIHDDSYEENYAYFMTCMDGWEDVLEESLEPDLQTSLKAYWDETGTTPDDLTEEAMSEVELKEFGHSII